MKKSTVHSSKILIIGDIMLDRYIFGDVSRISPEAPVPVLLQNEAKEKYVPGGAGNVAVNMVAIGTAADIMGVLGTDSNAERIQGIFEDAGIGTKLVLKSDSRPTTMKLRFIAQNNQQILRLDSEDASPVDEETVKKAQDMLETVIEDYDLILLSDYNKGFLTKDLCRSIIALAGDRKIPVLADVKGSDPLKYAGATLLKPNRKELSDLSGMNVGSVEEAVAAAAELLKKAGCKYVLATLGGDGMILVDENGLVRHEKTNAKEVYDVTGAGDTTIAYLAAELAKGTDIGEAMETANLAAGVQVSKVGTSVVYPEEVERARYAAGNSLYDKQLNFYRTGGLHRLEAKRKGRKVVFTNGCFDILHAGHVTYLSEAKKLGDILVVGVNSDASVSRLKGPGRPVNNVSDRLLLLAALESVDYVVAFEEDTPFDLIKAVRPDVLVKGGDYSVKDIVGADVVASYGGSTTTIPFVPGKSTTGIIERMKNDE